MVSRSELKIVSLFEGKGSVKGQIGMATLDLMSSEIELCQFVDTSSYSLLKIRLRLCDPLEVILPDDKEKSATKVVIMDLIQDTCKKANIVPIQRKFFNDALGIELLKRFSLEECSNLDASVYQKYFCMGAVAALIKYTESTHNIGFTHNSLRCIYVAIEDSCMIDVSSWKSLDLIQIDSKPKKGVITSLFDVLNSCVTPGGTKTLRSYLLQPSADCSVINKRLDIVQEFVLNQSMCDKIRKILSSLSDLQYMISMLSYSKFSDFGKEDSKRIIRNKIGQAVTLKNMLDVVEKLSYIITHSDLPFFVENRVKLTDCRLSKISEIVNKTISTEVNSRKRKGFAAVARDYALFAVAEKQNVLLDMARRVYTELVEHVMEYAEKEREEIPSAQLNYSQSRGYHFSLHTKDPFSAKLPPYCIQVVQNKSSITFTTRDLIKYNDRLIQSETDILQISNQILDQLIVNIRAYLPSLYKSSELISLLDCYASLACYSSKTRTVRPTFSDYIEIIGGRHPILDLRSEAVPNDTYAFRTEGRFIVIAGPNMSGKSTYMRQVCLLQIMAQMGCLIPAESATFVPMTHIFSRVGHNDDLVRNLSGFSVEMSEMATILQNANHSSLIIIDELARSTSTEEGIGMCYAICERLILIGAFTLFATHFLDMAQLEINYPGIVKNYHFSSINLNETSDIEATQHKLCKGQYLGPLYGLDLAAMTTFPEKIIKDAEKLAEKLKSAKENLSIVSISKLQLNKTFEVNEHSETIKTI
ncbi:DNA_MISMATCH_REPAIR_2 domain-containing protein [Meloidogyne graminicola]|uniref:DNA_MISMATCH_REPAIR_2 domain-containing protein n=1 Tax=Meloidogyne graminicola TaxID=189291 RepID=A0A8S9ZLU2_9BILA|nr:DNA_MISMATCH_REPAIR_2 domain-containing protein [Meloidogyne graminicola]